MVEYQNKSNGQTSNNLKNFAYRMPIRSNDHGKIDISSFYLIRIQHFVVRHSVFVLFVSAPNCVVHVHIVSTVYCTVR